MNPSIGRIFRAAIFLSFVGMAYGLPTASAATLSDLESQANSALSEVQTSVESESEDGVRQGLRDARDAAQQALAALRDSAGPTRDRLNAALDIAQAVVQAARSGAQYASENENSGLAGEATNAGDAGLELLAELLAAAQGFGDFDLAVGTAEGFETLGEALNFAAIQARREKDTALTNQILGVVDVLIPRAENAALFAGEMQRPDAALPAISALGITGETLTHLREATKGLTGARVQNAPGVRLRNLIGSLNRIQRAFGPNAPEAVKDAITAARQQIGRNDFKFGPPGSKGKKRDIVPASPI
jgi:hypothetical protein